MKSVKDSLLQRVSVRRYERERLTDAQLRFIYDAIRNTPTSYNGQQFSVIDVTDQAVKEQLAEICNQKQIKTCSHFLAFCADYHKISLAAEAKGIDMPDFYDTVDGVTVGVVDASLAMMSAIVAVEALGLGCCPIGYARTAAPARFAEILELPKHVFLVCGLAVGVPRERNDLKPKQGESLVIHNNKYRNDAELVKDVLEYDSIISAYNATRSGDTTTNDWTGHIIGYYIEAMRYNMLKALQDRGFDCKH